MKRITQLTTLLEGGTFEQANRMSQFSDHDMLLMHKDRYEHNCSSHLFPSAQLMAVKGYQLESHTIWQTETNDMVRGCVERIQAMENSVVGASHPGRGDQRQWLSIAPWANRSQHSSETKQRTRTTNIGLENETVTTCSEKCMVHPWIIRYPSTAVFTLGLAVAHK